MAGIKGFKRSLKAFADSIGVGVETAVRKISMQTFSGIVLKTPVDTGRARASWVIGINRPLNSPDFPEGRKMSAAEAQSIANRQLATLGRLKPYDTVFISNNLPYIEYLEDGSSEQAPSGMVAVTLAEIERGINDL